MKRPHLRVSERPAEAQRVGRYVRWVIGLGALLVALVIFLPPLIEKIKQEMGGGSLIERELAKVPSGYYSVDRYPDYGGRRSDLEGFLKGFSLPAGYQKGIFDCSESAAYVEYVLEDAGFKTHIVGSSYCPWGSGGHAWVIVYTSDGYRVAVETTALTGYGLWDRIKGFFTGKVKGIVYSGDRYEYYYYNPEFSYRDICEAIRSTGTASEWDWWFGV